MPLLQQLPFRSTFTSLGQKQANTTRIDYQLLSVYIQQTKRKSINEKQNAIGKTFMKLNEKLKSKKQNANPRMR